MSIVMETTMIWFKVLSTEIHIRIELLFKISDNIFIHGWRVMMTKWLKSVPELWHSWSDITLYSPPKGSWQQRDQKSSSEWNARTFSVERYVFEVIYIVRFSIHPSISVDNTFDLRDATKSYAENSGIIIEPLWTCYVIPQETSPMWSSISFCKYWFLIVNKR